MTPSEAATRAAARLTGLWKREVPKAEIAAAEREFREALHGIGIAACDEETAARVLSERRKG